MERVSVFFDMPSLSVGSILCHYFVMAFPGKPLSDIFAPTVNGGQRGELARASTLALEGP